MGITINDNNSINQLDLDLVLSNLSTYLNQESHNTQEQQHIDFPDFKLYSTQLELFIKQLKNTDQISSRLLLQGYALVFLLRQFFTGQDLILDYGGEYYNKEEQKKELQHRQVPYSILFASISKSNPALKIDAKGDLLVSRKGLNALQNCERTSIYPAIWKRLKDVGMPTKAQVQRYSIKLLNSQGQKVKLYPGQKSQNKIYLAYNESKRYGWYINLNKQLQRKINGQLATTEQLTYYNAGWLYEWLMSYINKQTTMPTIDQLGLNKTNENEAMTAFLTKVNQQGHTDNVPGRTGGDYDIYQYKLQNQHIMAKTDLIFTLQELSNIINNLIRPLSSEETIQRAIEMLFTNAQNKSSLQDMIQQRIALIKNKT